MKALVVVVLYNCEISESETLRSLARHANLVPSDWKFLVYDNSPVEGVDVALKTCLPNVGIQYVAAKENGGVLAAYSEGLKIARVQRDVWLVLLDQDTELSQDYILELNAAMRSAGPSNVAVVPIIRSQEFHVSPLVGRYFKRPLVSSGENCCRYVGFINSGAALRVDFIESIGGFHRDLWLDGLDHWISHQISKAGKRVFVLPVVLLHELSVLGGDRLSAFRVASIYAAERVLFREAMDPLQKAIYLVRLVARFFRTYLKEGDSDLRATIWAQMLDIIFGR